ncbi:MAG: EAL domain-containing protein [Firmicutes bacterium]|nr:EAL domain-containing protein [Bacillota bacterium]MBR5488173.1 EAL domain-containing protein [Bacillota bacterium]
MNSTLYDDLQNDRYDTWYQPIINGDDETIFACEALARRRSDGGIMKSAAARIEMYEDIGIIASLDFAMFRKICADLKRWGEMRPDLNFPVFVNCSRVTMSRPDFHIRIEEIRSEYGVPKKRFVFEATESHEETSETRLYALLEKLKKDGYLVAIDDFGVKHSSIESLSLFDWDIIKLSAGLIWTLPKSEKMEVLLKSLLTCCHGFGMKCLAEGVETEEQLKLIREAGADLIQGFYYAKPMPDADFEKKYL